MNSFKELNVQTPVIGFEGTQLEASQLIGREIAILDFKITPSKYPKPGKDKCLHLQLAIGEIKYVCFTPTLTLIRQIEQIDKAKFPFKTTIIRAGHRLEFS